MENILEFKGITVSKGIFRQMREIRQPEYAEYALLSERDSWNVANWRGYVIEAMETSVGEIQTKWYIFELDTTLVKIRDAELFWIMRNPEHLEPTKELAQVIPQIWVK